MAYRIEISYKEYVEYKDFDEFINTVALLMNGGKKRLEISKTDDEEEAEA